MSPRAPAVHAIVVGGGAIGVSAAYELTRAGASVVLLERGPRLGAGCSEGNAGLLVPSHASPLATPANLRAGVRFLLEPDGPLGVHLRPELVPWLARFALAATARRAREATAVVRALSVESLELHAQLADAGLASSWAHNAKSCDPEGPWVSTARSSHGLRPLSSTLERGGRSATNLLGPAGTGYRKPQARAGDLVGRARRAACLEGRAGRRRGARSARFRQPTASFGGVPPTKSAPPARFCPERVDMSSTSAGSDDPLPVSTRGRAQLEPRRACQGP